MICTADAARIATPVTAARTISVRVLTRASFHPRAALKLEVEATSEAVVAEAVVAEAGPLCSGERLGLLPTPRAPDRAPDRTRSQPMAQRAQRSIETARNAVPEGTFAVGAGLLVAGITA